MTIIRTAAICYLVVGICFATAWHCLFSIGAADSYSFDLGYLLGIVAFWPAFALMAFIFIVAAAGAP